MPDPTEFRLVWNRAIDGVKVGMRSGDWALASLLDFHGIAMNGGVLHATEHFDADEWDDAHHGFRYFGFENVAGLLVEAKAAFTSGLDLGSWEAKLNQRYYAALSNDTVIIDRVKARLLQSPSDFAPI